MVDDIKKEIPSLENRADKFEPEPGACDEVTISKTEVKEERYDSEMECASFFGDESECEEDSAEVQDPLGEVANERSPIDYKERPLSTEDGARKKQHACAVCQYSTDRRRDLLRHSRIHTKEKLFRCSVCEFATSYKHSLKTHTLLKHEDKDKRLRCTRCKFITFRRELLKKHMLKHVIENPFKCDLCDFATKREVYLKMHLLLKHTEKTKPHKCETCGYETTSTYRLKRHRRIHSSDKQYKCPHKACGSTKPNYVDKPCGCGPCDFATRHKISLNKHLLTKHSAERNYTCKRCGYLSHTKEGLIAHVPRGCCKPFGCDECDYTTMFRSNLKSHVLIRHSKKEGRYKCPHCKYSAHLRSKIDRHNLVHAKEKPYKCEYGGCEFKCTRRDDMNLHLRYRHDVEKPLRCGECEYSCRRGSQLTKHVKQKHVET